MICDRIIALWTVYCLILREFSNSYLLQTINMHLMEAVRSLQHSHIHIFLLLLSDQFITEFAETFLFHLLHLFIIRLSSFSFSEVHEIVKVIRIELLWLLVDLIARWRGDHTYIVIKFVFLKHIFLFHVLPRLIILHWWISRSYHCSSRTWPVAGN